MEAEFPEISKDTIKRVLKALGQAHNERVGEGLDSDEIPEDDWLNMVKDILNRGEDYPSLLTFDQFDSIPWDFEEHLGLDDSRPIEEIEKAALELAEKEGAKLYVQIDGFGDRVYNLGIPDRHYNKTGIYEVVRHDYWESW